MKMKPDLFDYNNFSAYLRHWYDYAHTTDPKKHSKANICRQLGLPNSRSSFTDVPAGTFVSRLPVPGSSSSPS